ncbi:MAG TPA: LysR family transcriptional regulator [Rhabdaerophilum sp.]|nr:LysR family transcriptional regulator [Rhabdaerophilum sp.]
MEVRWLQDFLALAESGNFTRAATARNTSQAAFSRRIQQLEAWLGAPLIDRSMLPTKLTPEGEQFRETASRILAEMLDARAACKGPTAGSAGLVRMAVPFALATSRFPVWWSEWRKDLLASCSMTAGNIHDLGIGLLSGAVEIMFSFHTAQQPVHPDPDRVEAIEIETDFLRPFASPALVERERIQLPGGARNPVPLLSYTPGVYFSRLVDLIVDSAGGIPHFRTVIESDMSDVLRDMAIAGHGIAWLPESTVAAGPKDALVPIGGAKWSMPLSVMAFRTRDNRNPVVTRLWSLMQRQHSPLPVIRRAAPTFNRSPRRLM